MRVLHHFHLVELVSAYHSALFRPRAARFLAVARRIGEEFHRQFAFVDYLACVHIDECGLRRGQHKAVAVSVLVEVQPIHLVAEFRELTRPVSAVVVELMRGQDELVAVFQVLLDEVIEQRPFQLRAQSTVNPETVAAELDSPFVIDESERSAEVDVVFDGERKLRLLTHNPDDLICFPFRRGAGRRRGGWEGGTRSPLFSPQAR